MSESNVCLSLSVDFRTAFFKTKKKKKKEKKKKDK